MIFQDMIELRNIVKNLEKNENPSNCHYMIFGFRTVIRIHHLDEQHEYLFKYIQRRISTAIVAVG